LVHSKTNLIKDKPLRRDLSFNSSMLLWEDKRNSSTDGWILLTMTFFINVAKLWLSYFSTVKKMFLLFQLLFLSRSSMLLNKCNLFTIFSAKWLILLSTIWKRLLIILKIMLRSKELILGSRNLPQFWLLTLRLISKNHSGDLNSIWTHLVFSIMHQSSLNSKSFITTSESIMN
jgi:hypothetical protein